MSETLQPATPSPLPTDSRHAQLTIGSWSTWHRGGGRRRGDWISPPKATLTRRPWMLEAGGCPQAWFVANSWTLAGSLMPNVGAKARMVALVAFGAKWP